MGSESIKKEIRIGYFGGGTLYSALPALAAEDYTVVMDEERPQIVLVKAESIRSFKSLAELRRKYGANVCVVSYTGESVPPSEDADYSFSFAPTNNKNFQILRDMDRRMRQSCQEIEERDRLKTTPKDKFCNFVYRNESLPDTKFRREFCELLSNYKTVDCPSKSLNNMPGVSVGEYPLDKLKFISRYKFTIAFENTSADYYVTEKIIHPLSVGSIPIYWGCPQITEYYNPESFINCHNYDSFEDVVERVREIDNNSELYERYLNAPQVLPNSRLNNMTKEAVKRRFNVIVEDALSRNKHGVLLKHLTYYRWFLRNFHRLFESEARIFCKVINNFTLRQISRMVKIIRYAATRNSIYP